MKDFFCLENYQKLACLATTLQTSSMLDIICRVVYKPFFLMTIVHPCMLRTGLDPIKDRHT